MGTPYVISLLVLAYLQKYSFTKPQLPSPLLMGNKLKIVLTTKIRQSRMIILYL
jgi:hypothetical protein